MVDVLELMAAVLEDSPSNRLTMLQTSGDLMACTCSLLYMSPLIFGCLGSASQCFPAVFAPAIILQAMYRHGISIAGKRAGVKFVTKGNV